MPPLEFCFGTLDQRMQSLPPDGDGHAELRHMAADRVGDLDALPDQDRPGPVQTLCCSGDFTGTKRIVGRVTASQIAAASAMSFFWRFT